MTNLLKAISNIVENPITDLVSFYKSSNRANSMGDALETYVKDIFCDCINSDNQEKDKFYSKNFSYLGNQNNPPDIIVKNGDAIEVKKIESLSAAIALNSSYPKNKLYADDSRITDSCRNCEVNTWEQKDIIYSVGVAPKGTNKLKAIWFVYGNCYAANREIYKRVADKISTGISEIPDVELVSVEPIRYPGVEYGTSVIWNEDDGYYYIYGKFLDWIVFKPILARCRPGQFLGEWEFYNGTPTWSSDPTDAVPIAPQVTAEYSAFQLEGEYYMFYQENGFLQCGALFWIKECGGRICPPALSQNDKWC